MTTEDTATVDQLILEHLDAADLPAAATDLVFAALLGEKEFAAALGGAVTRRPQPSTADDDPADSIGTWLSSIEVSGFRGIGEAATLNLTPGPGLTIVAGRNGSGKSSFAEAAELALTDDNRRWAGRTAVWQEGWRNLHAAGDPYIRVQLGVDGHRNGAIVECRWDGEAKLAERTTFLQVFGRPRQSLAELGWARPLELYRPFLSYSELGGLLGGRPSEMHDSLQRILGLGRLVEIEQMLKAARREMDDLRKRANAQLPALRTALADHPDPRARQAAEALTGKVADLDRLILLATSDESTDSGSVVPLRQLDVLELPDRDRVATDVERLRAALQSMSDLAGTPAEEARALAGLLGAALQHQQGHPDQPCPVCAGRTLDAGWAEQTRAELERLTRQAELLEQAHQTERDSRRALRERSPAMPAALSANLANARIDTAVARLAWQHWDQLLRSDDSQQIADTALDAFDALVAAVEPVRLAARKELERRQQAWRPLADQIRAWVAEAAESRRAAEMFTALQKAITWLQGTSRQIRNEKLAPIATRATEIWNMLRQESNVELGAIRLAGTGTTRRVDLDVTVDGVAGAALGVMSQGELHSLALALFLPRATMPESPFRFLMIDDPVQSMDPAKVYGLARVLAEVAQHRQVIVFTHDDRLLAAVRHLGLEAQVKTVSRLPRSQVTVEEIKNGNPADRYLDDARAIAQDEEIADQVRGTVAGNLIRHAIEYTCHEVIRARDFRAGVSVVDTEDAIGRADSLRKLLALTLLNSVERMGELPEALRRLDPYAPRVVATANRLAHGDYDGSPLTGLIEDARWVIERLRRR